MSGVVSIEHVKLPGENFVGIQESFESIDLVLVSGDGVVLRSIITSDQHLMSNVISHGFYPEKLAMCLRTVTFASTFRLPFLIV